MCGWCMYGECCEYVIVCCIFYWYCDGYYFVYEFFVVDVDVVCS